MPPCQGRTISEDQIATAMTWSEPNCDVRIAREQAIRLLDFRQTVLCSGRDVLFLSKLSMLTDRFPWAAWPGHDLWNSLLCTPQRKPELKRIDCRALNCCDRPRTGSQSWWDKGYLGADNHVLPGRFMTEAKATLPMIGL